MRAFYANLAAPAVGALFECLHVDDCWEALMFALGQSQTWPDELQFLNMSSGLHLTIRQLVEEVVADMCFLGAVEWDLIKSDVMPNNQLHVSRLAALGWQARIPLEEGLTKTLSLLRLQQLVRC